jgi:hypothetical protein
MRWYYHKLMNTDGDCWAAMRSYYQYYPCGYHVLVDSDEHEFEMLRAFSIREVILKSTENTTLCILQ